MSSYFSTRLVRESDFLIRWGGEEFLVVFRAAERNDGALLASRILKAINSMEFDLGNERRLARSCSVGWAAFPWLPPACSDLPVDEVLRLADRGLYIAKQQGRNQAIDFRSAISAYGLAGVGRDHALEESAIANASERIAERGLLQFAVRPREFRVALGHGPLQTVIFAPIPIPAPRDPKNEKHHSADAHNLGQPPLPP